jgi:ATP-dependent helicase Lhr and Lhr-like helicase
MTKADRLHPALLHHIVNTLGWPALRPLQDAAIGPVLDGQHALLLAPTAGGKTEAAVFPLLTRMVEEGWPPLSVLYLCPLRALLNNLHPRLEQYAGYVGRRAGLWHGDITSVPRQRIVTDPPDVLLTTPESIEAMLISARVDHRHLFANVRAVVVDEIHAFAGDDRGWHLLAVLERVAMLAGRDLQRVGLSATVGNPGNLAEWLRGSSTAPTTVISHGADPAEPAAAPEVGIDHVGSLANAAILLSKLHVGEKRLVFCDSRSEAEQLTRLLREQEVETFVSHASLARDERRRAEEAFAQSRNCIIVATSTLELGIDVGDLDRVVQIGAPLTVASFLQRLGRTGRRLGTVRNCLLLTTDDRRFLHALGLARAWADGFIEPVVPPPEPVHLLVQQLLAVSLQQGRVGRRTWPDNAARLPELSRLAALVGDNLVDHLLTTGVLFEDQGLMWMGVEGERSYGFRHFRDLTGVFATEPLLTVRHGRAELGSVHPMSVERRYDRPPVLLLAGRAWKVRQVDWRRRQVFVEASDARGRSRWMGAGRPMSAVLCRALRAVLAGTDPGVTLSLRATDALDRGRARHWWVRRGDTTVVHGGDAQPRWWTFAGGLANRQMVALMGLRTPLGATPGDLAIELQPGTTAQELRRMLDRLPLELPPAPVFPDALAGLKFSQSLPAHLAAQVLGARFSDSEAIRQVAAEQVSAASA